MCGSGAKTSGTRTTSARRRMARRGCRRRRGLAVVRGGSWDDVPQYLRSANRVGFATVSRGFVSASGSGGRLHLEYLPLDLLGPGRSPGEFLRPWFRCTDNSKRTGAAIEAHYFAAVHEFAAGTSRRWSVAGFRRVADVGGHPIGRRHATLLIGVTGRTAMRSVMTSRRASLFT